MTIQEIFNRIATHLLTQGERSVQVTKYGDNHFSKCAYRGDGGMKCAVGVLIPDENYRERLEGLGGGSPDVLRACGLYDAPMSSIHLICDLQEIHDKVSPADWPAHLLHLAQKYSLTTPEILNEAR